MSTLASIQSGDALKASDEGRARVQALEAEMSKQPQIIPLTHHVLHGGMYARTLHVNAGTALTGVEIELATILIVSGDCVVTNGDTSVELSGYNVIPGSAHRKQAFYAVGPLDMTMVFPTAARSITEAEDQFTKEAYRLLSRQCAESNIIIVTGE